MSRDPKLLDWIISRERTVFVSLPERLVRVTSAHDDSMWEIELTEEQATKAIADMTRAYYGDDL